MRKTFVAFTVLFGIWFISFSGIYFGLSLNFRDTVVQSGTFSGILLKDLIEIQNSIWRFYWPVLASLLPPMIYFCTHRVKMMKKGWGELITWSIIAFSVFINADLAIQAYFFCKNPMMNISDFLNLLANRSATTLGAGTAAVSTFLAAAGYNDEKKSEDVRKSIFV